ncbi:hypothetical protein [Nodularia sphaerocarpa]|uniref:hypothetical protein n=1 Tax=Nodularia sphaerocarpa TaxID=137816 RepID=UPI001EFAE1C7|nr:hypothetical protein [Nodularia sphaerocarpa]MDB9376229.1 hypothetical protein [Nodularia sphaerocarpa CS-585]ULP74323.1 hypothetical protein BDGGKGIB_03987 [Nodularia sphaerocarpa UHCC 0038]
MPNQALSPFFPQRGSIIPPKNIGILAIDDHSISIPEEYYKTDPPQYAYLEPQNSSPFKRLHTLRSKKRLVFRTIAPDVVFDLPSSYTILIHRQIQGALPKYGSKNT